MNTNQAMQYILHAQLDQAISRWVADDEYDEEMLLALRWASPLMTYADSKELARLLDDIEEGGEAPSIVLPPALTKAALTGERTIVHDSVPPAQGLLKESTACATCELERSEAVCLNCRR